MWAAIVCACAASPPALLPSVDPDLLDQDRSSCESNIEAKPDGRVTPGCCDDCHRGYFRTAASHRDAVASGGLLACECDSTDVPVVDLRVQGVQVPMFLWDAERGFEVVATVGNQRGAARVSLWNPQTGALLDEIPLGTDAELKMNAISPDQKHIAAADIAGTLWIVDLASREIRSIETTHTERIDGMNFSTDAKRLVTVGWDKTIKLWELATGDLICEKPAASPLVLRGI